MVSHPLDSDTIVHLLHDFAATLQLKTIINKRFQNDNLGKSLRSSPKLCTYRQRFLPMTYGIDWNGCENKASCGAGEGLGHLNYSVLHRLIPIIVQVSMLLGNIFMLMRQALEPFFYGMVFFPGQAL